MPTVVDAARVTTSPSAVWRICTGCGWLAPLPPEIDHCDRCISGPDTCAGPVDPAAEAWERIYRYAETIGRIQAWVCPNDLHGMTAEARLAKVRDALAHLDRELGRRCR